ncbi:hypothetical protein GCM10010347_65500 [Streptomyces cirratus]|uniref:Uncharacterized protein n=1 Tax=Streptomyces cirratus TaxID=68187 RepID=A0ABQ3F5I1_9ACTN|nr:hypothetical protein GCM10010347_65500 [Streptomyces cirratus]
MVVVEFGALGAAGVQVVADRNDAVRLLVRQFLQALQSLRGDPADKVRDRRFGPACSSGTRVLNPTTVKSALSTMRYRILLLPSIVRRKAIRDWELSAAPVRRAILEASWMGKPRTWRCGALCCDQAGPGRSGPC